jgi:type I restriction enzyme S subunit
MSSEFTVLEDVADVVDSLHKTPTYVEVGLPMVRVTDVKYGFLNLSNTFRVDKEVFNEFSRRYKPKTNDIVITRVGSFGITALVQDTNFCLGQNTAAILPTDINPRYLYAALNSPMVRDQINAGAVGSTQKTLSLKVIKSLKVPRLGEKQENEIALLSGSIDNRIALLRDTNTTLEAIAQALFKSWFVDFDPVHANAAFLENGQAPSLPAEIQALFPSRLVESPQGLIPEGWEVGLLGDVAETSRKQVKPEQLSNETLYVGLEHIPRKQLGLDAWGSAEELASAKSAFERNDILFGKLRPYFHKVVIAPFEGVCSTDILVCRAKHDSYHYYVAMQLFSDELISYADRLSNGAKMPRINWKDLAAYEVVIPPNEIAETFSGMVEPMIGRILANVEKAQTLANLRDTLLPRLISGQLRLPEAEAVLAEVG